MSNQTVGGADVGKVIVDMVRKYNADVIAAIREEVGAAAKDIKAGVQAGSPVKSGRYKKGWKITNQDSPSGLLRIIHNAAVPGLPHLLEHGHAKRGGGRVAAIPHIAVVAEPRIAEMEENIIRRLEKGNY